MLQKILVITFMRKKINTYILAGLCLGICSLYAYNSIEKISITKQAIAEVENFFVNDTEINEEIFSAAINDIDFKMLKGNNITHDEYFLSAFDAYKEEKYDLTLDILKILENKLEVKDNTVTKIYSGKILSELLMKNGKYDEAFDTVLHTVKILNSKEYNERFYHIFQIICPMIYIENTNGKEKALEALESILENSKGINKDVLIDIKSNTATIYGMNGNHAKSVEKFMEVIALSEMIDDKYFEAKSYADIGITYTILGNYTDAVKYFKKSLAVNLDDPKDNAFLKTYVLSNLYEVILYEEKYEEIMNLTNEMKKYTEYLPEYISSEVNIANYSMLVTYYLKQGNLNEAENMLKKADELINENEKYVFLYVFNFYYISKGDLLYAQGKIDEAISTYNKILEKSDEEISSFARKYALNKLVYIYNECGQYEKGREYIDKLIDFFNIEAQKINEDYAEYALYKYEYELQLNEAANEKIRKYLLTICIILVLSIILIVVYIKYFNLMKINKSDALTKANNRRYFEDIYRNLVNSTKEFSIIMVDVDNFKIINDTYGHAFGDNILKSTVEKLKAVINNDGRIFRYGGEEFIIILEAVDDDKIIKIAEDMLENVQSIKYGDTGFVTISIGIAKSSKDFRDILEKADSNLYLSKTTGKNKFTI